MSRGRWSVVNDQYFEFRIPDFGFGISDFGFHRWNLPCSNGDMLHDRRRSGRMPPEFPRLDRGAPSRSVLPEDTTPSYTGLVPSGERIEEPESATLRVVGCPTSLVGYGNLLVLVACQGLEDNDSGSRSNDQ